MIAVAAEVMLRPQSLMFSALVVFGCADMEPREEGRSTPRPEAEGVKQDEAPANVEPLDFELPFNPGRVEGAAFDSEADQGHPYLRNISCTAVALGYAFDSAEERAAVVGGELDGEPDAPAQAGCVSMEPTAVELLASNLYKNADAARSNLILGMRVIARAGDRTFELKLFQTWAPDINDFKWRAEAVAAEGAETPLSDADYLATLVAELGPGANAEGTLWADFFIPTTWDELPAGVVRALEAEVGARTKGGRQLITQSMPRIIERGPAGLPANLPEEVKARHRQNERRRVGYVVPVLVREPQGDSPGHLYFDADLKVVATHPESLAL